MFLIMLDSTTKQAIETAHLVVQVRTSKGIKKNKALSFFFFFRFCNFRTFFPFFFLRHECLVNKF